MALNYTILKNFNLITKLGFEKLNRSNQIKSLYNNFIVLI